MVKVASRCNLNCRYCYIYNGHDDRYLFQPKQISDEVYDALLTRIDSYVERSHQPISLAFHGGEPTLIGLPRFLELIDRARLVLGSKLANIAIQTNATLLDSRWARAIKSRQVAPSISIDGPRHIHDATRITLRGQGSHHRVVRGIEELQAVGIQPNVLCVVSPGEDGLEVYRHLRSLNVTQMDFLLPDVSHDDFPKLYGRVGRTPVADYLLPILHAWMSENDDCVRIRIFWELFQKLLGGNGITDLFGRAGTSYLVVETDGEVEAMDALRACANEISKTGINVLRDDLFELENASPLTYDLIHGRIPVAEICSSCPKQRVCGGGYLPSRYSRQKVFNNPSVWCSDISLLIDAMQDYIDRDDGDVTSAASS